MMGEILIVEDEKDTVELLRYNLGREGYKTEVALDGKRALELFRVMKPDLVLLDVMLPERDGRELCKIFRSINESIPIIMLTALGSENDRLDGLDLGADDYISKPFSVRELMMKIKRHAGREKIRKNLQERAGEVDEKIRYMVHELKNSLVSLEGFSNLAVMNGKTEKYMPFIRSSAQHMSQVLDNLHLLRSLESGESLQLKEEIDIFNEVTGLVQMYVDGAGEKGIEMSLLNDTCITIAGNEAAVRQVLMNILSNAIKYNKKGGKVMIFFEEYDDYLEVYISDTGIGIAKGEIESIFEKDYRADGSEEICGSGFGLYLSKLLMTAMGGNITATSRVDSGSVFMLSFKKGLKNNFSYQ